MDSLTLASLSPYYHIIFTTLAFLVLSLIFVFSRKTNSKRVKLPPGPPGWPIVGNLFQVAASGKHFILYVKDIAPKYGPIFTLKMGSRNMIVITSAELAYEALIEKGQVFSSRAPEYATRSIFSCNKFTVNASFYGPVWRALRRNMVQNMLSSTKLKEFKGVRVSGMDKLVERIRSEGEKNDGVVMVLKNARYCVFCILLAMCFGVELDQGEIDEIDEMMKTVLITTDPRLDDFLPLLWPFFGKHRKRALEVRKQQVDMIVPLIQKRKLALRNGDQTLSFAYLDTLFELKMENRGSGLSDGEIVTLCSEFLNGGTDTTGTAIEWAIARLIENPSIQSRLYDEIKATVGDEKVDEKDVEKMPYLNAIIKELLRKHPPTYFALTHGVTEPAKLAGYDIPINTNVDFFLPGISEDPKIWSSPEKFDPDRFYSGRESADITGAGGVKMIPFGMGRRICPGLSMATVHVSLMLARMVQEFEWDGYPESGKVDFSETLEFTTVMKNSLRARIKPRV